MAFFCSVAHKTNRMCCLTYPRPGLVLPVSFWCIACELPMSELVFSLDLEVVKICTESVQKSNCDGKAVCSPSLTCAQTTTNKTTNNLAALVTAPSTNTLIPGLFMLPTYHMKDRNQAQTLNSMWHHHLT